jgi:signal transduction histidine kinase
MEVDKRLARGQCGQRRAKAMSMNLNRLKWLAIALPLAFVMFLRLTTEGALGSILSTWNAYLAFIAALAAGIFFFATVIFSWLDRSQRASEARTRELEALNDLGRRLTGTLSRDTVVTIVLETAHEIVGARAVGISLQDRAAGAPVWRAMGDRKDDLEQAVLRAPPETWQAPSAHIVTGDGDSALLVSAPMGLPDSPAALLALLDPDSAPSLTSVSRLMYGLANHASAALERCRLFGDVQRREQRSRALYEVGLEIVSSQNLQRVLQQITQHACELAHVRAAALCLLNEHDGRLSLMETAGDPTIVVRADDIAWASAPAASPRLGDGRILPCTVFAEPHGDHTIRSPLIVGSNVVGELCVVHEQHQSFTADERELLAGLAHMAAIAIHNSRLLERERQVAVLEERDHLAREMHDTLAQVLGYLHLKAATTRKHLESGEIERAEEGLEEMQDLAHEAYVDVREAILGLRETVGPAGGVIGGLRQYLLKFGRQSGINARLLAPEGVRVALAPAAEIQLLRVVQEALTNVRKHSDATSAIVRLESLDDGLRIAIEDNGRGFDSSRVDREEGRSFGLRSMKERIEGAGGRFNVESSPGNGTRIILLLPSYEGGGRYVPDEGSAG